MATQPFYVTINDVLGADRTGAPFNKNSMTLFQAWTGSRDAERAAIARGAELFGTKPIAIRSVRGLNEGRGLPSCASCLVSSHSVSRGISSLRSLSGGRRRQMPLIR